MAGPFTLPAQHRTEPATWGQAQTSVDKLKEEGNLKVSAGIKERLNVLPKDPSLGGHTRVGLGGWEHGRKALGQGGN